MPTAGTNPVLMATVVTDLPAAMREESLDHKAFPHRLHTLCLIYQTL